MTRVWGKMTNKIDNITNILGQDDERTGLLGQDDDIYIAMVSSSGLGHLTPTIYVPKTDLYKLFRQQKMAHSGLNRFITECTRCQSLT